MPKPPLHRTLLTLGCLLLTAPTALAAEPPKPKITIGKETTYITEPLRPDGYPDYVAALNKRMSEGVTPENNAAVLLAKAFGPDAFDDSTCDEAYKQLGIESLPKEGNYLISQEKFTRRWRNERRQDPFLESEAEILEQFETAMERPWSRNEFPIVAAWIAANEIPVKLAIDASKRPKYFWPYMIINGEVVPTLIAALLEHATKSKEVVFLLASRAMNQIAEKNLSAAWQDILACHNLARTIGKGYCLVEGLLACGMENVAINTAVSFSHYGKLTAAEARDYLKDLEPLPPVCNLAVCYDLGDRFMLLDTIAHICREGRFGAWLDVIKLITALSGKNTPIPTKKDDSWFPLDPFVDWNIPMKMTNAWFDRLTTVASIDDRRERSRAVREFDRDIKRLSENAGNRLRFAIDLIADQSSSRDFWGRKFGEVTLALFMPAIVAPAAAEVALKSVAKWRKSCSVWPPIAPIMANTPKNSKPSCRDTSLNCQMTPSGRNRGRSVTGATAKPTCYGPFTPTAKTTAE